MPDCDFEPELRAHERQSARSEAHGSAHHAVQQVVPQVGASATNHSPMHHRACSAFRVKRLGRVGCNDGSAGAKVVLGRVRAANMLLVRPGSFDLQELCHQIPRRPEHAARQGGGQERARGHHSSIQGAGVGRGAGGQGAAVRAQSGRWQAPSQDAREHHFRSTVRS